MARIRHLAIRTENPEKLAAFYSTKPERFVPFRYPDRKYGRDAGPR